MQDGRLTRTCETVRGASGVALRAYRIHSQVHALLLLRPAGWLSDRMHGGSRTAAVLALLVPGGLMLAQLRFASSVYPCYTVRSLQKRKLIVQYITALVDFLPPSSDFVHHPKLIQCSSTDAISLLGGFLETLLAISWSTC